MAKIEQKKELIHIKEQKKKELENEKKNEKKNEKIREKEKQLHDAIKMNQGFIPDYSKGIHKQIINNLRQDQYNITSTSFPTFVSAPPRNSYLNESNVPALNHTFTEARGINNTTDLTTGHVPTSNLMVMFPNNFVSLVNNITGTVDIYQ